MGNYITTALTICNREQSPEVVAFATEVTQKASMEELGVDITDHANRDSLRSFRIYKKRTLCWDDYTSYTKHLNVDGIIKLDSILKCNALKLDSISLLS